MFDHFVWSVLVVPPLLVLVVRLLADRLWPSTAAVAVAWSAVAAAGSSLVNLVLFALKAVAEIPAVGRLLGWSAQRVAADTAHVPWVSVGSAAMLAFVTVAMTRRWHRHRRTLRDARRDLPAGVQLVMVRNDAAQAFAIPGNPGHVVVTTGMRGALTNDQFDALLAHERAHLTQGHHRLVWVAELAAAAHPALWWVSRHVSYLVERAADEQAAEEVGSRSLVAHAIGVAALADRGQAVFGLHAAAGGVVPRRVAGLLRPRSVFRLGVASLLPVVVALSSVVWTGEAAYDLVELLYRSRVRT
ncbi:M56 family metallopeptidase [Dactylosporangium sp. AC04546]|uniref:M56 family metallopeptidase n=1 Tax=Dactylosporangium sp. AC04546 TaxID=2862460 RepID=UPI001EDFDB22|nr:M56 family metallopeptidase [Dactylosporangium sp. AC04546]WVK88941.1 M56 family metallopeptidase [Dactylosporangium sp. AC04546]